MPARRKFKVLTLICLRCDYGSGDKKWIPRGMSIPKKCPSCGNPNWNRVFVRPHKEYKKREELGDGDGRRENEGMRRVVLDRMEREEMERLESVEKQLERIKEDIQ